MEACGLTFVDPGEAQAPWAWPFLQGYRLLADSDWRAALSGAAARRGLTTALGRPLRFVDADDAGGLAYEMHVAGSGRVPTRANRHDAFNAMVWLALPQLKRALNALQQRHLAQHGVTGRRGRERDAGTLLDENGLLLLCADQRAAEELRAHAWTALFLDGRHRWHRALHPVLCGHALLDKLGSPYKAVTAHVLVLPLAQPGPCPDLASIDRSAAERVAGGEFSPADLLPLPVLGIPGWWPGNENPGFYRDTAVFRPARRACAANTPRSCGASA